MSPDAPAILSSALRSLAAVGTPFGWLLVAASVVLFALSVTRVRPSWRRPALLAVVALLLAGELLLLGFHLQLYRVAGVAAPIWIESEKLYLWAVIFGVMAALARRHRDELEPLLGAFLAVFAAGAVLFGKPFTEPLPQFVATLQAVFAAPSGSQQAMAAAQQFIGLRSYYASPFMWVHPPLLFFCYGAFVVGFAAVVLMLRHRHGAFETTAYRWTRLGYLPLTAGMLLGFPWAISAWQGEAWWWSGKVNMSVMMWILYTAYLHGRLYLRRQGMWRWVAVLAVLSFVALVLTYLTTYVIPGAHSVAG